MIGIFVILACWGVGNLLSMLTGGYVSGNVIGMVLLYAMLHYRVVKAEQVVLVIAVIGVVCQKMRKR